MSRLSRVLAGSTFRVWLYSIVLVLATTTMAIAAAFQDMYDWNVHEYPQAAAVLLAGAALYMLSMPVLHFYFHRKRPTSSVSSPTIEIAALGVLLVLLVAGSIATCARQHQVYDTDPFVPSLAIGLEVVGWVTAFGVAISIVSAYLRRHLEDERHRELKHGGSELV